MMQKSIRVFSALIFLAGLSAFVYLASLPRDAQNSFLDFSPFRLVSLAGILTVIGLSGFIFFKYGSFEKIAALTEWIKKSRHTTFLSFILFTLSLTAWVSILYKELMVAWFNEAV